MKRTPITLLASVAICMADSANAGIAYGYTEDVKEMAVELDAQFYQLLHLQQEINELERQQEILKLELEDLKTHKISNE